VPGVVTRELDDVRQAFTAWFAARHPGASDVAVDLRSHATGGYSNEVFFGAAEWKVEGRAHEEALVLRLPPNGPSLFPSYDLAMQVAVQVAAGAERVPVPAPIVHEEDESWLGSPFLVMPRVAGHDVGELAVVDEWLSAASVDEQRALHERFLDVLAQIHAVPWEGRPVAAHLRGVEVARQEKEGTGTAPATALATAPNASLLAELDWWDGLVAWTFDGAPPAALTDLFAWCRAHVPAVAPPSSVLWGDVRLGNVIFDEGFRPVAVLDWEMASVGPAELDLAWYVALEEMAEHFVQQRVPGFLARDEVLARHERALGRPLVDFRWFEVFAMCRSAALNIRADRLGAARRGKPPRPTEDDGVLAYAAAVIRDL